MVARRSSTSEAAFFAGVGDPVVLVGEVGRLATALFEFIWAAVRRSPPGDFVFVGEAEVSVLSILLIGDVVTEAP